MRFLGINDRNAAEALKGLELFVDRTTLPDEDLDEDEFFYADLEGLEAVDCEGRIYGVVSGIFDFGGGDLLELKGRGTASDPDSVLRGRGPRNRPVGRRHRRRSRCGRARRQPPNGPGQPPAPAAAQVARKGRQRIVSFRATVLTLYPEMFPGHLGHSLSGRALGRGDWTLETVQIRDFAEDRHRTVDDTPAGGGAGMVLRPDVLARAIDHAAPPEMRAPGS